MPTYVPGYGCSSAKLVVLGEAPGAHEEEQGRPFAGPSGSLLDEALAGTPITRNDVYITNVVKVRPPDNDIKRLAELGQTIEDFMPQLWTELETINPNCILALGGTALTALTGFKGIEKYRGSILQCFKTGQKVVPTLHPASLLHNFNDGGMTSWREFAWIKNDVVRAYEQSLFRAYNPPNRLLHVARNSVDVIRFLERHQNKEKVTLDVETFKTYAQCIGLAFNSWEAMSIPLFADKLAEINHIPSHDQSYIWKLIAEFLGDTRIKLMAQNAKFDEKRCRQLGLKWHKCYFDMAMGWHILYPEFPKKLQFISSVLTEEPFYKDEGGEYNPKKDKIDRWFLYNAKDAVVEYECCEKILQELDSLGLTEYYFDRIQPLHYLYSDIEDVGFMIDERVRKELHKKYTDILAAKHEKLVRNIADGDDSLYTEYKSFNVMSNGMKNQVAKLVFGYLKCPLRKDTKDETLKSLANNAVKDQRRKDILIGILEERKLRKTLGTYIDAAVSEDRRIHTQCNVNGTETGRTSTGILQPPVSIDKRGVALQTMTKHEDVTLDAGGGDLRAMYIADPGFVLIEPDLAQAEDRVVCVLSKDWDALKEYARTEFKKNKNGLKDDRHTKTAIAVTDIDFEGITDWERQVGKKTRHSGNYNVGKHQHMLTLAKSGIFISEYKAGKQLERFHSDNPKIRAVFHAEIEQALRDNDCLLITPLMRQRRFFNKWGDELFKEAYAYIPQSTISDQTKFAMLDLTLKFKREYKRDFFFLLESHDSFVALVRESFAEEFKHASKQMLERPINFKKCSLSRDYNLVIPADFKQGKRWIEKCPDYPDGLAKA